MPEASPLSLKLERPLVVFDLEATGISVLTDRIVAITIAKIFPRGEGDMDVRSRLINPTIPIPPEATDIHGVTDDDVAAAPTFAQVAKSLAGLLDGCDLAGFNIVRFDIPLLLAEFHRAGVVFPMHERKILDAYQIYRKREPRTLEAALHHYCGESHDDAHDSEGDVLATLKVIEGQLRMYEDLPRDLAALDAHFNPKSGKYLDWEGKLRWERGEVIIGFGKHLGTPLRHMAEHDRGFLNWILRGEFAPEVKQVIEDALAGHFPEPPAAIAAEPAGDGAAETDLAEDDGASQI